MNIVWITVYDSDGQKLKESIHETEVLGERIMEPVKELVKKANKETEPRRVTIDIALGVNKL